jgi:hypothetical protein
LNGGLSWLAGRSVSEGRFSEEALESSALMISPPSTWTHAHDLTEGASDSCLIREACLFRNVG